MKKSLVIGAFVFLLLTNIIFIGTTVAYKNKLDKQKVKVYSFDGQDSNIKVTDVIVIISPNKQVVNGGMVQYIGNRKNNIRSYSEAIYISKQNSKRTFFTKGVSNSRGSEGMSFPDEFMLNSDVGKTSSESLFTDDDIKSIKDNLYFSLNYITIGGQKENVTVKLEAKEFNIT